jgi:hypothetical protein
MWYGWWLSCLHKAGIFKMVPKILHYRRRQGYECRFVPTICIFSAYICTRVHFPDTCLVIVTAFTPLVHLTKTLKTTNSGKAEIIFDLTNRDTGDSCDSFYVYRQWFVNGQLAGICTSVPLPRHGKYPLATNVCQAYQAWESGLNSKYNYLQTRNVVSWRTC